MSRLNDVIEESVRMQDAPFLVAMVEDRDGVKWSGAAGDRAPGQKATTDTVFRIFSMTKAIGCTAAMILMDRGKLDPNAPVESIIPEFKEIKVWTASTAMRPAFALQGPRRPCATSRPTPRASFTNSGTRIFPNTCRRPDT